LAEAVASCQPGEGDVPRWETAARINGCPGNLVNIRWCTKARFGMSVHFGLYAVHGRGEWVRFLDQIPRDEYMGLMAQFDPSRFDADEWVGIAQSAGARYITITAKQYGDAWCVLPQAA
jgi:alpha-L-fucosidase